MQPNCLVDGGMSTIAVTDQAANINGLSISRKCRYLRTALFYIDYFTTNNLPWMLQWSVAFVNFTKETKQLHKQIEQQLKLQVHIYGKQKVKLECKSVTKKRKKPEVSTDDDYVEEDDEEIHGRKTVRKNRYPGLKTRSSPRQLALGVKVLNDYQKKIIKEMGFGELLDFKVDGISSKIAHYVVDILDIDLMVLKVGELHIKVDKEAIHKLLGIPCEGIKFEELVQTVKLHPQVQSWRNRFPKEENIVTTQIVHYLTAGVDDEVFVTQMDFLMLFISSMADSHKNSRVKDSILQCFSGDTDFSKIDWCNYVLSHIKTSKKKWKNNISTSNYVGPLTVLVGWTKDRLKFREEYEIRNGGFGLRQRKELSSGDVLIRINEGEMKSIDEALGFKEKMLIVEEMNETVLELKNKYETMLLDKNEWSESGNGKDEARDSIDHVLMSLNEGTNNAFIDDRGNAVERYMEYSENDQSVNMFTGAEATQEKLADKKVGVKDLVKKDGQSVDGDGDKNEGLVVENEGTTMPKDSVRNKEDGAAAKYEDDKALNMGQAGYIDSKAVTTGGYGDKVKKGSILDDRACSVSSKLNIEVVGNERKEESMIMPQELKNDVTVAVFRKDFVSIDKSSSTKKVVSYLDDSEIPGFSIGLTQEEEKTVEVPKVNRVLPIKLNFDDDGEIETEVSQKEEMVWEFVLKHCEEKDKLKTNKPNEDEEKLGRGIAGDEMEEEKYPYVLFQSKFGERGEAYVFRTLKPDCEVYGCIIDMWDAVMNLEGKKRPDWLTRRLFCGINTVVDWMLHSKSEDHASRPVAFTKNMLGTLSGSLHEMDLESVDLLFIPIVEHKHFYLVVFDLKDKVINVIDQHQGELEFGWKELLVHYLELWRHKSLIGLKAQPIDRLNITWATTKNTTYSGVFVMRHMEKFNGGGLPFRAGFNSNGLRKKNQLKTLRKKIAAKILLSYGNIYKEKIEAELGIGQES
ncbi:hypothetical protein QVD17_12595 [Tagetes erecta]|uniref:Ubiquitin-like protease family profile domain-containing protein n=1 Tax=Tagetes erecta TaxID=13708 RepID=A0AAD8L2D8_TARER|nr:hypothetical protein QVD17_12595 [Tagetes erecta]